MIDTYVASLVQYGLDKGLIEESDRTYITNQVLQLMELDSYEPAEPLETPLQVILNGFLEDAVKRNLCKDNTVANIGVQGVQTR